MVLLPFRARSNYSTHKQGRLMTTDSLNLKFCGDPALKKKSSKVEAITDDIKELASKMVGVMFQYDGIGLAAPQVGISKNLIIINLGPEHLEDISSASPGEALLLPQMPIAFVNPEILAFGKKMSTREEGCLSVPEIYAHVTRPTTIVLKAQMLSNEMINIECGGLLARALQHEIDHLNGILFIDRLTPENYKKIKKKLDRLKKRQNKK